MKTKWFFFRGLIRESGHWNGFIEKFSSRFPVEVCALDLPGSGKLYQTECPTSIEEMVHILRKDFLNLRGEKNYLFCISLGAMLGLQWSKMYPDFSGGVFINSSVKGLNPFYQRLRWQNYGKILSTLFSSDQTYREKTILELTSNKHAGSNQIIDAWVRIQKERPVSRANAIRQLRAAISFSPPSELSLSKSLILRGMGDRLVHPSCSEAMAKKWNIPMRSHPEAGHDLTLDAPDWALDQVADFFRKEIYES